MSSSDPSSFSDQNRKPASCLAIILAAGEGTRMKSTKPKVLHAVAGRSLVGHAIHTALDAGVSHIATIIGPDRGDVRNEITRIAPGAIILEQNERRGTAHAVLQARDAIIEGHMAVLVLFGDTPLVEAKTVRQMTEEVTSGGAMVAVMGFEAADPAGYGRLLVENGNLVAIREHRDASEAERRVTLSNGGLMALRGDVALELLEQVRAENAQSEFYLTDCVEIAIAKGGIARVVTVPEEEAQGVNDRVQLAACEAVMQSRLRKIHMREGVTMVAPETVFLSMDTKIARDVIIDPNCVFGPGVNVDEGAHIHAFCHLEGAEVGPDASIGPYARLRPGAKLEKKARIGNFVEVKNAKIGVGAKANHLAYIGDASVGAGANIGAGTITCNYDGFGKHRTEIGAGAFIGTNSSLVAPVKIGARAYIGSGSVITKEVPPGALATERAELKIHAGWVARFEARPENIAKRAEKIKKGE